MGSDRLRVNCVTFRLPKEGNASDEYEDAAFPGDTTTDCVHHFRCAVADGATESSFSGIWARLLAKGYVEGFDLSNLQSEWLRNITQSPMPWYAEEKAKQGAFSSLVGLTIHGNKRWEARAVGDSCFVQVRENRIIHSFPLEKAAEFNNSPYLLSSVERNNQNIEGYWRTAKGTWKFNDLFLLMTDALSHWLFSQQEDSRDGLSEIVGLSNQESFSAFIARQRRLSGKKLQMRNDDVTLLKASVVKVEQ